MLPLPRRAERRLRLTRRVSSPSLNSLNHLSGKSVPAAPKVAERAPLTLIVDAFLVRAADNAAGHGNRERSVLFNELQNLPGDIGIVANVASGYFPITHDRYVLVLG